MARQKTVFPTDEIAHLWANAAQDEARNAHGNFSFSGPLLISYRTTIAARLDDGARFLLASHVYSNTTSKQQHNARAAIPNKRAVFFIPTIPDSVTGYTRNAGGAAGRARFLADCRALWLEEAADISARVSPKMRGRACGLHAELVKVLDTAARFGCKKLPRLAPLKTAGDFEEARAALIAYRRKHNTKNDARLFAACVSGARGALHRANELHAQGLENARRVFEEATRAANNAREAETLATMCNYKNELKQARELIKEAAALLSLVELPALAADTLNAADRLRRTIENGAAWQVAQLERETRAAGELLTEAAKKRGLHFSAFFTPEKLADLRAVMKAAAEYKTDRLAETCRGNVAGAAGQNSARLAVIISECRELIKEAPQKAPDITAETVAHLETLHAAAVEKERIEHETRAARWHAGEKIDAYTLRDLPPLLRIEGAEIVTSWGARVPLTVAPALWSLVKLARETGADISGDFGDVARVGYYTLDTVKADGGLIVGCHNIPAAEIDYIARALEYIA